MKIKPFWGDNPQKEIVRTRECPSLRCVPCSGQEGLAVPEPEEAKDSEEKMKCKRYCEKHQTLVLKILKV